MLSRHNFRRHLGRYAAAQVAVFILFAPYLANLHQDWTRYAYFWRTTDTLSLAGLILAMGLGCWLIGEAAIRSRVSVVQAMTRGALVLVVFTGLGGLLNFGSGKLYGSQLPPTGLAMTLVGVLAVAVIVADRLRPGWAIMRPFRRLSQVALPIVPVTIISLLLRATYPTNVEPWPEPQRPASTASATSRPAMPVYLFIFDEWSYQRTFEGTRPRADLPNLRALAEQSIIAHDAHSPGARTEMSMPGLVLGMPGTPDVQDGVVGFKTPDRFFPAAEATTVFEPLGERGWRTVMLGFALPYRLWLTDGVEVCRPRCYYPRPETLGSPSLWHLLNASHYTPHAWWQRQYKALEGRAIGRVCRQLLTDIRADAERVIRDEPQPMVVVHYPLPHPPAVLNPDLTFRPLNEIGWDPRWVGQYRSNLEALDTLVGVFVQRMREAGRYDQCLLILTSDHTWRDDPDRKGQAGDALTHVPLLIKLPGQQHPLEVSERLETWRLGQFINSVAQHRPAEPAAAARDLLRAGSPQPTTAGAPR